MIEAIRAKLELLSNLIFGIKDVKIENKELKAKNEELEAENKANKEQLAEIDDKLQTLIDGIQEDNQEEVAEDNQEEVAEDNQEVQE